MINWSKAREARRRRPRLAKGAAFALALAAVAALGLLASACGGSSGEAVAQVDSNASTTTAARSASKPDPAAYSACMRRNGVPKFPDPNAQGHLDIQGGPGLDPNSPRFKAAEKACRKFMPSGPPNQKPSPEEQARELQEALKYSACMRRNGVPTFPDPKANAEGGIELTGADLEPDSPQFKAAEQACKDLAPGANGGATSKRSAPGATP